MGFFSIQPKFFQLPTLQQAMHFNQTWTFVYIPIWMTSKARSHDLARFGLNPIIFTIPKPCNLIMTTLSSAKCQSGEMENQTHWWQRCWTYIHLSLSP
jgi:hypothetical protein